MSANSNRMKALWADPEYRARMLERMKSPEAIEKQRKGASAAWTKERRLAFGDYVSKRVRTDPEYRAKVLESTRKATIASLNRRAPEYLRNMTPKEREDYNLLKKKKFTKAEALEKLGEYRRAGQSKAAAD